MASISVFASLLVVLALLVINSSATILKFTVEIYKGEATCREHCKKACENKIPPGEDADIFPVKRYRIITFPFNTMLPTTIIYIFIVIFFPPATLCSRMASQLFEDLMYSYNRVVRPVKNSSEALMVKFGASLIRIIDVDSRKQILTTNLWLEIQWQDSKLAWNPDDYGGIRKIHMPSTEIWLPDIVLYNNAAGDAEISIYTDALVYYDGKIVWKPPAIYKSFCEIDVTYFPYDEQFCEMKFGMWTHTARFVDLIQLPEEAIRVIEDGSPPEPGMPAPVVQYLDVGMDLSYYVRNAEWDVLNITSKRHVQVYTTCCGPEHYVDIVYYIRLRRKTLFYTVNLIIPCALISFLTTFVFYIPATPGGHQLTFAISILVTLTVFFLVLIELLPPTSKVIPLFGRYLLFTMILVTLSIIISVICVNFHHRTGVTHVMPNWVRVVFLHWVPKILFMERPKPDVPEAVPGTKESWGTKQFEDARVPNFEAAYERNKRLLCPSYWSSETQRLADPNGSPKGPSYEEYMKRMHALLILRVIKNVQFISNHFRVLEEEDELSHDWKYVAMVIDRIFFIIFAIANCVGTVVIILNAPSLYDNTEPMMIPLPTKPLGGDTLGPLYSSPS